MTDYVKDLREVKAEDIEHSSNGRKVAGIVYCPDAQECSKIAIVYSDANNMTCTIDGRLYSDTEQLFLYKTKMVRYLKPLHVILNEASEYHIEYNGTIKSKDWGNNIVYGMFHFFGKKFDAMSTGFIYDNRWTEEREERI
jgi:hypothetical protein